MSSKLSEATVNENSLWLRFIYLFVRAISLFERRISRVRLHLIFLLALFPQKSRLVVQRAL